MTKQISIFDIEPEVESSLTMCVKLGSGFQDGKERIMQYINSASSKAELIDRVKKEYGIGGRTFKNGWFDFDAKGFEITEKNINTGKYEKKMYTWVSVVNEIVRLAASDRY